MANENGNQNDCHPILPKLKQDSALEGFKDCGQWSIRTKAAIENLSKGLDVDRVATNINSIPDIWARPLLFEMALFDVNHLLHDRIKAEWRGMLALLALREELRLSKFTALKISFDAFAHLENDPMFRFAPAVRRLLPQETLATDASWKHLYLFLYDNRAVGMTSPVTLVATATDYVDRLDGDKVKWFDGARLQDPVNYLPNSQKAQLGGWLTNLYQNLVKHPAKISGGAINVKWNSLLKLIDQFQQELGAATNFLPGGSLEIAGEEVRFFSYLDAPCARVSGDPATESDVLLIPSRTPTPAKRILIVDKKIAAQWNVSPKTVRIVGATTLDSIPLGGVDSANRHEFTGQAEAWQPEEFFTAKLVVLPENTLPGTFPINASDSLKPKGMAVTPIIPLKKVLIEQLTAKDLAQRVRFKQVGDSLEVRVSLPLSGINGQRRNFEAVKIYPKDDIVPIQTAPLLEVFPNFTGDDWKAYYTCYSSANVATTFGITPFAANAEATAPAEVSIGKSGKRYFWRTEAFPELMFCRVNVANTLTNQFEQQEVGVLLLETPDRVDSHNLTFDVGVDFGATGTNVYASNNQATPLPVNFRKRLRTITEVSQSDRAELYNYFLPNTDLEAPYLSLYHYFNNHAKLADFEPLLNGHIYFLPDYDTFDATNTTLRIDLKWSEDEEDRIMARAFLTQICLQAAAEAVAGGATQMNLLFSYPTAFSKDQHQAIQENWQKVQKKCQEMTGLEINQLEEGTESVAAAKFFRHYENPPASLQSGAIVIDIGGSTSDVSIWQRNTLIQQMSLRFAGRDLFLDYLWAQPEFLKNFDIDCTSLVNAKKKARRNAFYAQADAVLRHESSRIFDKLPDKTGTAPVKNLWQHLTFGLGGVFYYLGLSLRHLIEEKDENGNPRFEPEIPNIYLGGNGSRMFRWFAPNSPNYNNRSRFNEFFRKIFLHAANLKLPSRNNPATNEEQTKLQDSFSFTTSSLPKAEAAYGLVCGELQLTVPSRSDDEEMIAGENFKLAGDAKTWDETVNAEKLVEGLDTPAELERLKDFIEIFNRLAKSEGIAGIKDDQLRRLLPETKRQLAERLSEFKGKKDEEIHIEPIFILSLKEFLKLKNDLT